MRVARTTLFASLVLAVVTLPGCQGTPGAPEPEWQKPPKSFDTKGESLTFGNKGLDAFNTKSPDDRIAWLEEMKAKPGSFKGQGIFRKREELGDKMDDRVHGKFEAFADVPPGFEPLYEITIDYFLYNDADLGQGLPNGAYVEFAGTLIDFTYKEEAKPRKLEVKAKIDSLNVLKDN
jgi:hypothetical protein